MKPETVRALLKINQEFYANYAQSFDTSRYSVQPGVRRLLPQILHADKVVDLGCGNGNLAGQLANQGFMGTYLGTDENPYFLHQAAHNLAGAANGAYAFREESLADMAWLGQIAPSNAICCFAALHHLPGTELHHQFFAAVSSSLSDGGLFFVSCWQVRGNARLASRIVSWEAQSIPTAQLDENDLLVDWRADPEKPAKLRYVRHFSASDLRKLGSSHGLHLQEEFYSDGKEGNLGLYQVWQKT